MYKSSAFHPLERGITIYNYLKFSFFGVAILLLGWRYLKQNDVSSYQTHTVRVETCYDGDTCNISSKRLGENVRVRLVGVDTPEIGRNGKQSQFHANASKKWLNKSIGNRVVRFVNHGLDRYGRVLGEFILDGRNINVELLKVGNGRAFMLHKNQIVRNDYLKAQEHAKSHELGIWGYDVPPHPSRYRRKK